MAGYDEMLPPRWVYRFVTFNCSPYVASDQRKLEKALLDEMNSLGAQGWELVAATPIMAEDVTQEIRYVFKRRDE
jgi:hypothetical protein